MTQDLLDLYGVERELLKARARLSDLEARNHDAGAWDDVKGLIDQASELVVRYRDELPQTRVASPTLLQLGGRIIPLTRMR